MGAPVVVVKPAEVMVAMVGRVEARAVAKKVVEAMLEAPAERQVEWQVPCRDTADASRSTTRPHCNQKQMDRTDSHTFLGRC